MPVALRPSQKVHCSGGHGLSLRVIPEKSRETPLTTCYVLNWCQSARSYWYTVSTFVVVLARHKIYHGGTTSETILVMGSIVYPNQHQEQNQQGTEDAMQGPTERIEDANPNHLD